MERNMYSTLKKRVFSFRSRLILIRKQKVHHECLCMAAHLLLSEAEGCSWTSMLPIGNASLISAVLHIQIFFFPTCDFFIFKLNRCICISFKKSVTLSSMKMPFRTMGLFRGCSRMGLLLSIFFLSLIRDGKIQIKQGENVSFLIWFKSLLITVASRTAAVLDTAGVGLCGRRG